MEMIVLGKAPAVSDEDGASSGYLLSCRDQHLLLDCGNGVTSQLRRHLNPADLGQVFISHLHADHCFDLVPLAYSLKLVPSPFGSPSERPTLWLPPGGTGALEDLCRVIGSEQLLNEVFEVVEYSNQEFGIAPFELRVAEVPHVIPTWAVDVSAEGRRLMTYGADCAVNDALEELADSTPTLLAEGTMGPDEENSGIHMTPREAGELARRAGAKRLVVTHYSDLRDPRWVQSEAEAGFGREIVLARSGLRLGFNPG